MKQSMQRTTLLGLAALLCGLLLWPGTGARAQETRDRNLERLQEALESGDVEAVLGQAAERIDVTLFSANALYSRAQAQYVLRDFFREYPPRRFAFKEPSRRDENWFAAGQYWYGSSDEPLAVYVRLRRQGERWELREIRIDRRAKE